MSIETIKNRITQWFQEEGFNPTEITDPNAHFNIVVTVANLPFNVVQDIRKRDSFFVGTRVTFTNNQLASFRRLSREKKQSYTWNLRMELLKNPGLGNFEIRHNPPKDISEVFISSRPIFYDAITKDKVISTIHTIFKAAMMTIWKLEEISGTRPTSLQSPYIS